MDKRQSLSLKLVSVIVFVGAVSDCRPATAWSYRTREGLVNTNEPLSIETKRCFAKSPTVKNLPQPDDEFKFDTADRVISFAPVTRIQVHQGVDNYVFDDPDILPDVHTAEFFDCTNLKPLLHNLHENYPEIKTIALNYSKPLKSEDLQTLDLFESLNRLYLSCMFVDCKLPSVKFPTMTVLTLVTGDYSVRKAAILRAPKLVTLEIENTKFDEALITEINAPQLERLQLYAVDVSDRSFSKLSRFSKLNTICFESTEIPISELESLRSVRSLREIEIKDSRIKGIRESLGEYLERLLPAVTITYKK